MTPYDKKDLIQEAFARVHGRASVSLLKRLHLGGKVPFGMEMTAGDVETFLRGVADLDALVVAARVERVSADERSSKRPSVPHVLTKPTCENSADASQTKGIQLIACPLP
jgi:hypothetical protein